MKLAITGATGRMGRMLLQEAQQTPGVTLAVASAKTGDAAIGEDVATLIGGSATGIIITDSALELFGTADMIIDFTRPEYTLELAALAAERGVALVTGTTGFTPAQMETLHARAQTTRIFHSANMSLGVNILAALIEKAAATLGPDWDIEILEMHHRHKIDAPSGTALLLGDAAARGRNINPPSARDVDHDRNGNRMPGDIGFSSLRGGDVVGEHRVFFAGAGERIELAHTATNRAIFARGAVKAALWLHGKPNGFYTFRDMME